MEVIKDSLSNKRIRTNLDKQSYYKRLLSDIVKNKYIYIMALPIALYYIIFHYVPMGGLLIAFQDFNPFKGITSSPWVGMKHFTAFLNSTYAWRVIRNTFLLNLYQIVFGFPAPIMLALLLNEVRNKSYKKVIQTVSYMPHFISLVVICGMIVEFTLTDGLVNDIIVFFGGARKNLLMEKSLFRTMFVSTGIWQQVGWGSIIYLATLSGIDPNLYEAAAIDGAGRFKQMFHITLPSLIPTIIVLLIMRLGHIMSQGFEKVILLYNPLTYETADVISSYVYRRGLQEANYSFGAAVGLFNSLANCTVLLLSNYISKKHLQESLW